MKRYIVDALLVLAAFGSVALAATFTDIDSPQYFGKTGIPKAHAAIDANFALIEGGTASVDGKYVVVGPDATVGLMVCTGAVTSTSTELQTNDFDTVFGGIPIVQCTYSEDPGDVQPLYVSTVTASNFIVGVTADKNFAYIAVGARP